MFESTLSDPPKAAILFLVVIVGLVIVSLRPYAVAQPERTQVKPSPYRSAPISPEDQSIGALPAAKMEEGLQELAGVVTRTHKKREAREDISEELDQIEAKAREFKELDKTIREDFRKIEERLKRARLPRKIVQRHYDFVKDYEDNFSDLMLRIKNLGLDEKELGDRIRELSNFLEEKKPKEVHIPLDPERLPHRTMPVEQLEFEEYKEPRKPRLRLKPRPEGNEPNGELHDQEPGQTPPKQQQQNEMNRIDHRLDAILGWSGMDGGYGGSQLDQYEPVELAMAGWPDVLQALIGAPVDSTYLKETVEVHFTDEITELAESLNHSPLEIYEYLRNSFDYEPYYGSLKGAQQTLWERRGNDFDLASLLIALLRVSGIQARYVRGEVIIPIQKLMNWLGGIQDTLTAGQVIATNGIPGVFLKSGGKITAVKMQHCWVEAFVDYIPSRGAVHEEGDTWMPVDPSYKQYAYHRSMDISEEVTFDEETYLDSADALSPFDVFVGEIRKYIEANYPDSMISDAVSGAILEEENLGVLPAALPYEVDGTTSRYAEIPDTYRHKVIFEASGRSGQTGFSYTGSTPELANKTIAVFYGPATPEDEQVIEEYGDLYVTPAYLVDLKSQLRIAGEVVATGDPIGFGESELFEMRFYFPGKGEIDRIENEAKAGAWYGVAINLQNVPGEWMTEHSDTLISLLEGISVPDTEAVTPEPEWAEEFLHGMGVCYLAQLDICDRILRGFLHIASNREPSEMLISFDAAVSYLLGIPCSVRLCGLMGDADRIIEKPFSVDGKAEIVRMYNIVSGYESSFQEHFLLESYTGDSAVSAVRALQTASQNGIPLHLIDSSNVDSLVPLLEVPASLKSEIEDAVNAGKAVRISDEEITQENWQGVGYIAMDPDVGTAAYMISGGFSGWRNSKNEQTNGKGIGSVLERLGRQIGTIVGNPKWWEDILGVEVWWECNALWVRRRFYQMGYFFGPFVAEPKNLAPVRKALTNQCNTAFYYVGHGDTSEPHGIPYLVLQPGTIRNPGTTLEPDELSIIFGEAEPQPDFRFVFLNACFSAHQGHALGDVFPGDEKATVGWLGPEEVKAWIALDYSEEFSDLAVKREYTVGEIFDSLFVYPYVRHDSLVAGWEPSLDGNDTLRIEY